MEIVQDSTLRCSVWGTNSHRAKEWCWSNCILPCFNRLANRGGDFCSDFEETFLHIGLFPLFTCLGWFPVFQCTKITSLVWAEQGWCACVYLWREWVEGISNTQSGWLCFDSQLNSVPGSCQSGSEFLLDITTKCSELWLFNFLFNLFSDCWKVYWIFIGKQAGSHPKWGGKLIASYSFPLICAEPLPSFSFTRFIFIDLQQ